MTPKRFPKCATGLTRHAHCLGHIGAEAHMVEHIYQCVKIPLEA